MATQICQAAEAKKALDICLIDIQKISRVADYIIVCSVNSRPQLRAVSDEIDRRCEETKISRPKWEGFEDSNWLVLDLGNIIVHIMGKAERDYYQLEDLWTKSAVIYHM